MPMAISTENIEAEIPLLRVSVDDDDGVLIDYKGRPANRSETGRWKSAFFIIGVEVAERFAYFGISSNLINYLTGPLGQSTVTAAANVNTWSGVATLLPLLGAFVADSYLGRYLTILLASLLYILGLGLLTLSAVLSSSPGSCINGQTNAKNTSCSPPQFQVIFFFSSLYLIAIGQGGHKPCVQAFGADQFDGKDQEECKAKSSFFNLWYFGLCTGPILALLILTYIQDNLNWALGYGIPCVSMVFALAVFLVGTKTYRYTTRLTKKSPFMRIGSVFVKAFRNWQITSFKEETRGTQHSQHSQQFRFLNKALVARDGSKESEQVCTINEVEDAKALLRLVPIWTTCLVYAVVFAQTTTFFTEQGLTMDRSIGTSSFTIPAASLQSLIGVSILLLIPIYDRIFVPFAGVLTNLPSGITVLQRIGVGMFVSIVSMVVAALVERKRKRLQSTSFEYGLLVDMAVNMTGVPLMSIWWLAPQYLLCGIADVFTMVGLQEFFYDQVPNELRSVGLSLYLSILGVGSLLSSSLISLLQNITSYYGHDSWFSDNLNRGGHLDYFYWLLAGFSFLELIAYVHFAKSFIYST